jgi:uncharacterized membrane protein
MTHSHPPWGATWIMAALIILANVDAVLSVLLTAGYGVTTAVAAAGTVGAVTAEIIARFFTGADPGQPFALPRQ